MMDGHVGTFRRAARCVLSKQASAHAAAVPGLSARAPGSDAGKAQTLSLGQPRLSLLQSNMKRAV